MPRRLGAMPRLHDAHPFREVASRDQPQYSSQPFPPNAESSGVKASKGAKFPNPFQSFNHLAHCVIYRLLCDALSSTHSLHHRIHAPRSLRNNNGRVRSAQVPRSQRRSDSLQRCRHAVCMQCALAYSDSNVLRIHCAGARVKEEDAFRWRRRRFGPLVHHRPAHCNGISVIRTGG